MWPFKKKQTNSEVFIELMPEIERFVAQKWQIFHNTKHLIFKEDVSIEDQLGLFVTPMIDGIRKNFPQINASPDGAILICIARGIDFTGKVSKSEIARGLKIPVELLE